MTDLEINEAVARKLGWVYHEDASPLCWEMPINSTVYVRSYPDYCHSIAAAWEVVEFVRGKYAFDLHSSKEKFFVNLSGPTWKQMVSGEADTAPMAICLAFLELGKK
jgi:hypothetical protein